MNSDRHKIEEFPGDELDELLAGLFAGGLDHDPEGRLAQRLREDHSARQQYRDHCQMHALLKSEHGVLTAMTELPQHQGSWPFRRLAKHGVRVLRGVLPAFAAHTLGALLRPWGWRAAPRPESPPQAPCNLPREVDSPVATLARVVGADLRFMGQTIKDAAAASSISAGDYHLQSGLVELTFECGASIVVECPARFKIVNAETVRCDQGRLSACVPESACGFAVETPAATAVDLGTAFAVEVRPHGDDEFHVFDGTVQVWPRVATRQKPVELTSGLATRVERTSGVPAGISLDLWRFVRNLDEHDSPYSDRVRQCNPVAYYRMRLDGDGYTLYDESGGNHHGRIVTNVPQKSIWAASPFGAALRMRGERVPTYAVVPDYPKTTNHQLSVVALVYAESRPWWASIAKNWAGGFEWGQFHFGLFDYHGGLEAAVNNGQGEEVFVRDAEPLPLKVWCHVAFVADGANLSLYRDGRLVDQTPCTTIVTETKIPQLAIGTKLNAEGQEPENLDCSFWDGRLDEVAVFNQTLSAREVRQLYELSRERGTL